MIEFLNKIDTQLFLFLNGLHNGLWDFIMVWLSDKYIWFPFYLFLAYLFIKNYGKNSYKFIILALLVFAVTDMVSYHIFKLLIHRLRPCHEPTLQDIIHLVNGKCGGLYGFVSSHAANTFGLATFVTLTLSKKIKYLSPIILFWSSMVSYSRIYLGAHYPGDVLCGALFGVITAYLFYLISQKWISV